VTVSFSTWSGRAIQQSICFRIVLTKRNAELPVGSKADMRDPKEATVLVTGATDGLGKHVALQLAERGATVLLHGRSKDRCEAVLEELRTQTGTEGTRYYLADLSSLNAVRGLAEQILSEHERLDVLVNNAGIISSEREESEDGLELTFAVNYQAHFLLTNLLLPLLQNSAPARIINVASAGQSPVDFRDVMLERGYDGMRAYAQSKLAQIIFTLDLAERLRDTGVTANALHPATLMDTKMVFETFGRASSSVCEGADATVRLAISPQLEWVTGRYFDGTREARANRQAYDTEARKRLWDLSEELCGRLLEPFPVNV
jgi:NAD(P)-dependent dehydrogenase (short-subunit alcohol dehydrogenase family)